ncbi:MAG TPA: PKD domain-containing protein, partial [Blastocatellia bacterium]|nr:PKD domain-containing protein [Blastocatellia bacterium]
STTTSDDAAFSTVFSGTAANNSSLQEFLFPALVDAKYVQFFWKTGYNANSVTVDELDVLAAPLDGSVVVGYSSQFGTTTTPTHALDYDWQNGNWLTATGQVNNQWVKLLLPRGDLWLIDQVALQPGWSGTNHTVAAKDFDILVSTTDSADASFATVFSGTLVNNDQLQRFSFTPVQARYVKLLIKNNYGSTSQTALQAFQVVSPQAGGVAARFFDTSTDADGIITAWSWNFGDGGSSTVRDPFHLYAAPGAYTVTLTVTDDTGLQNTKQITYNAIDTLVANFTFSPRDANEAVDLVNFLNTSSYRFGTATATWDLGDGTSQTGGNPAHTYADNGLYQVKLSIGDPLGLLLSVTKPITVSNLPPTVSIPAGSTLVWGQQWTAAPTISDPSSVDQPTLQCTWDFGDGQSTGINNCNNTTGTVTHAYATPGNYSATLTVTDKDGGVTSKSASNVVNKRGTAFSAFGSQVAGGSVTLQATLKDTFTDLGLAGKTVTFLLNGASATATTDASGVAAATVSYTPGPGAASASVSYAGDNFYLATTGGFDVAGQPAVARCVADSRGTDFWLMFPASGKGALVNSIQITSETTNFGIVSMPFRNYSAPFTVAAHGLVTVSVPAGSHGAASDAVENQGIHVTAQNPITIYAYDYWLWASESFLALPTDALGTEYRALGYRNIPGAAVKGSIFSVVAIANGTTVTITPSATTGSRTAGVPYTVLLNQGQNYQLYNTTDGEDLSGSLITANKPIAVWGGHFGTRIPDLSAWENPLVEQLPPVAAWDREFITVTTKTHTKDTFRFLAATDNTAVNVNGNLVATLNAGQWYEQLITGPAHILASNPILVAQYGNSQLYEYGSGGDPYMSLVPPVTKYLNSYAVSSVFTDFEASNYLNIVTPTSAIGTILLDGTVIGSSNFAPVGASGYSVAQLLVGKGLHNLNGSAPFGVMGYGLAAADAYGHPCGNCVLQQSTNINLTLTPKTATASTGTQDCVVAKVTDLNGNVVTGASVSFTVTGANSAVGSIQTDSVGEARFCYTGAAVGSDLITASVSGATDSANKTWTAPGSNQAPSVNAGPDQTIT